MYDSKLQQQGVFKAFAKMMLSDRDSMLEFILSLFYAAEVWVQNFEQQ